MNKIQQFYNTNQFPGFYTREQLDNYSIPINNPYLNFIESHIRNASTILDVGCGTGLISNLIALMYPEKQITALDFSDGIDFASSFSNENHLNNITYIKEDFLSAKLNQKFDIIICQGVLHHVPDYIFASQKLSRLTNKLILGVYHPLGMLTKKIYFGTFGSSVLKIDQKLNPFETSFTKKEVQELFDQFQIINQYPNSAIEIASKYKNSGLVTYYLIK